MGEKEIDKLLTLDEARKRAPGVTVRTWYGWIRDGKLDAVRPGKRLLVRESAVDALFARRTR